MLRRGSSIPASLYRVRVDPTDQRFETFDFFDNLTTLGVGFRTGSLGLICLFDGGLHRRFRSANWDFLNGHALHPVQFAELAARLFYDGTVLHEDATQVTYYWNEPIRTVVSQLHTPRDFDPYLAENHDPARLASFIAQHVAYDPAQILRPGGQTVSCLRDKNGNFLRFAVTDEEIEAARADPDQVVFGPMAANWRAVKPHG